MIRTYSELIKLKTFDERFEYLKLSGSVGQSTFGFDRYLNQMFYKSELWKNVRDEIIIRDHGCNLGIRDYEIAGVIIVHHMNPVLVKDIVDKTDILLNPEYLISTSFITHNHLHYGFNKPISIILERKPNDTCPWKI